MYSFMPVFSESFIKNEIELAYKENNRPLRWALEELLRSYDHIKRLEKLKTEADNLADLAQIAGEVAGHTTHQIIACLAKKYLEHNKQ